jgi:hypothetical protein
MKYLQHTSKSDETFRTYSRNIIERVQHPDLPLKHQNATLATRKRRQMKHLRHAFGTLATYLSKKQIKHRG